MNQLSINKESTISSLENISERVIFALKNEDMDLINKCHDDFHKIKHLYKDSIITMFSLFWGDCAKGILDSMSEETTTKTYLVQNSTTELFKIGRTKQQIKTRIGQFEGMSGGDIYIIGFVEKDIERFLHKKFKNKRVKGEWFDLSKEEVNEILIFFG